MSENGGIQVSPMWQFQSEDEDKLVTFKGGPFSHKPKSNMISACFSKSPKLGLAILFSAALQQKSTSMQLSN